MVQLSHLYITTVKTIALTIWAFVSNMISLLFSYHIFRFAFPHWTKPPMRAGSTSIFSSVYPQPPRPDIKSAPNEYLSNGQRDFWLFSQSSANLGSRKKRLHCELGAVSIASDLVQAV